ncbi:MAG TPA: ribosomal-protein-alanine N-acetyltransferase [Candidatus Thioglobus sp.]|jgi:ribosomal-protein-alanine N-acetyltransferase|nr:ribosomal-protein-alanine N-acetyltransferase [Candidatus Thioglobus sp.]
MSLDIFIKMKQIIKPINTSFREASKQDLTQILAIENRAYEHPWNEQKFIDSFDNNNSQIQLILLNETIAGYLLSLQSIEFIDILNICIDPDFQRQGLAKQLLNHLVASQQGGVINAILLEVRKSNTIAISFYLNYGFKLIDTRKKYYSNGEDAKILNLQIM